MYMLHVHCLHKLCRSRHPWYSDEFECALLFYVSTDFRRYGIPPKFFYLRTSELPSELVFNSTEFLRIPTRGVSRNFGELRGGKILRNYRNPFP